MDLLPRYNDNRLLKFLTPHEQKYIVNSTQAHRLLPGDVLMRRGEVDDTMFLVESGKLDVIEEQPDGSEVSISTLLPGDVLGEIAFLTRMTRTATVRAREESVVRAFNRANLRLVAETAPEIMGKISMAISEILCYRLRSTLELVTELTERLQALESELQATGAPIPATITEMAECLSEVEQQVV